VLVSAFEIGGQRVLEGQDPVGVKAELVASTAMVFDRLEHGLAELGAQREDQRA